MEDRTKFTVAAFIIISLAFAAILIVALSMQGCARAVWMDRDAAVRFNAFNASVRRWDERCRADPNTCAESLSTMAEELAVWTAIVNGTEPNYGI